MVEASWNEPIVASCPMERISKKFKRLTRALQPRGQKQVGHIKTQLGLAREILHRLEIAQDLRALTAEELWLKHELKQSCLVLSSLERTVARLRSCIRHLKDGDANMMLFHREAGFHHRKKHIARLLRDGEVVQLF